MKKKLFAFLEEYSGWLALFAALLGIGFYAAQSWDLAHRLTTFVWDEAMYLYKGYLFAIGKYRPFEDFGPWTNQMPVSFLIPGYAQEFFGLGMRSGRMYAFVLGIFTVVGLWLAFYRSHGLWLAAGVVWIVALNSVWINAFSQVNSQLLTNFFFAWMLALSAGKGRKTWELCLAAALAGLAGMTRINVLPIVFLFGVYVIWQYGWKTGALAAAAGLLPIFIFHAAYWPNILKIWAYWIPESLFSGILDFRSPWREIFLPPDFSWWPINNWLTNPDHIAWHGIGFIFLALRASFVPFFGVLATLLLWPKQKNWCSDFDRKFSIFLLVSYLSMFLIHSWAALGGKTCTFSCLVGYMLFSDFFGLVLIAVAVKSWTLDSKLWKQIVIFLIVFVLVFLIVSGNQQNTTPLRTFLGEDFLGYELPRFSDGELLPGSVTLVQLLKNRFGWHLNPLRLFILYDPAFDLIVRWLTILGIAVIPPIVLSLILRTKAPKSTRPFGKMVILSTLAVGFLFSYPHFFEDGLDQYICEDDVISGYEKVGAELNEVIPSGELLYWHVKSDMLLLYLPNNEIYLPQANARYTLVDDPQADLEELLRFGFWNYEIKEKWIAETNYIVIENRDFDSGWRQLVTDGVFEIILQSSDPESCRAGISNVIVLHRLDEN